MVQAEYFVWPNFLNARIHNLHLAYSLCTITRGIARTIENAEWPTWNVSANRSIRLQAINFEEFLCTCSVSEVPYPSFNIPNSVAIIHDGLDSRILVWCSLTVLDIEFSNKFDGRFGCVWWSRRCCHRDRRWKWYSVHRNRNGQTAIVSAWQDVRGSARLLRASIPKIHVVIARVLNRQRRTRCGRDVGKKCCRCGNRPWQRSLRRRRFPARFGIAVTSTNATVPWRVVIQIRKPSEI